MPLATVRPVSSVTAVPPPGLSDSNLSSIAPKSLPIFGDFPSLCGCCRRSGNPGRPLADRRARLERGSGPAGIGTMTPERGFFSALPASQIVEHVPSESAARSRVLSLVSVGRGDGLGFEVDIDGSSKPSSRPQAAKRGVHAAVVRTRCPCPNAVSVPPPRMMIFLFSRVAPLRSSVAVVSSKTACKPRTRGRQVSTRRLGGDDAVVPFALPRLNALRGGVLCFATGNWNVEKPGVFFARRESSRWAIVSGRVGPIPCPARGRNLDVAGPSRSRWTRSHSRRSFRAGCPNRRRVPPHPTPRNASLAPKPTSRNILENHRSDPSSSRKTFRPSTPRALERSPDQEDPPSRRRHRDFRRRSVSSHRRPHTPITQSIKPALISRLRSAFFCSASLERPCRWPSPRPRPLHLRVSTGRPAGNFSKVTRGHFTTT